MKLRFRLVAATLLWALAGAALAQAQPADKPYQPEVGQEGKDVVWVPTSQALVDRMLDLAKLTSADVLIDLGSGDGRTVITAAKRGARAYGIEYNPDMVELSKRNAAQAGVADRATFEKADLFQSDFSHATVITMFLLPTINVQLRPKILQLKPGTRIVSNTFTMGEWEADQTATVGDPDASYYRTALLWIVPARVDGHWRTPQGDIEFVQSFQTFSGMLNTGGRSVRIENGKLNGEEIRFTAGGTTYAGRVRGDAIEGTASAPGAPAAPWTATRRKP